MKRVVWLVVGVLLVVGGVWAYHKLFPSDEELIRRTLLEIEKYGSFTSEEKPLSRLGNASKLGSFFSEDVVVRLHLADVGQRDFEGRENLRQAAMSARNLMSSLRLEFVDPQFQLSTDHTSATMTTTLKATPSDGGLQVLELKLALRKVDGRWFVNRVDSTRSQNFRAF